jgi:hypothetical protein
VENRAYDCGARLKAGEAMIRGFLDGDWEDAEERDREILLEKDAEWQNAIAKFVAGHENGATELGQAKHAEHVI